MSSQSINKQLIIIGAGGLGREVLDLVQLINKFDRQFQILGFSDDALPKGFLINGYKILGSLAECMQMQQVQFVIAISNPSIRLKVYEQLRNHQKELINLMHPTAQLSSYAGTEPNSGFILFGNTFIGPNTKIGANVLIHTNTVIGHDSVIGLHTMVMQSCVLNGMVTVEEAVLIGPSSVVNGKHLIRKSSVLAAGSKLA
jgi:sugar O-acyltransferase (sialic acid O-acetyltransferase NeuD family)